MPRPEARFGISGAALAAALVICALGAGAAAQDSASDKLERVQRALEEGRSRQHTLEEKASELKREVEALRRDLIARAASAQRQEDAVSELERRLAALTAEEAGKSRDLARRRAELTATLGALQRLGRQPPEALIASPASAVDAVRSSLLLAAVVPALESRAQRLRDELDALALLHTRIINRKAELATANEALAGERRGLDRLLARKAALQKETETEREAQSRRLARLAREADSLRALVAKLEAERRAREAEQRIVLRPPRAPAPPGEDAGALLLPVPPSALPGDGAAPPRPARTFSAARGSLPLPARGRVIRRFGQRTEFGTPAKGITIETRPRAQVVAPFDGRVVFAGPFRGYGQLLIIEHGEGYHTLIAGLSRTDGSVGQWLLAGEPIGQMGEDGGDRPTLYVELRRDGEPINLLPWLAEGERGSSG